MPQFISVDHQVCTGCKECEVICSLYHFGECNPERSAIRVIRRERNGLVEPLPLVCQQCEDAPCMEACPVDALVRDNPMALMTVDKEICTGCGECMDACPAGCIFLDIQKEVAICCDLCGGQPQCVDLCHSNCLKLAKGDEENKNRVVNLATVLEKRLRGGV